MSVDGQIRILVKADGRYPANAYHFVLQGVAAAVARRNHTRCEHVSAGGLLEVLVHLAREQYGPYALGVLNAWGICCGLDFGNIVFELSEVGLLAISEDDTLELFEDFDLRGAIGTDLKIESYSEMPVIKDWKEI